MTNPLRILNYLSGSLLGFALAFGATQQPNAQDTTTRLEGVVLDRETGEPLPDARVRFEWVDTLTRNQNILSSEDKTRLARGLPPLATVLSVTGPDGRFSLTAPRLGSGRYILAASRDGYTGARIDGSGSVQTLQLFVPVGAPYSSLVIRMIREGVITGRIMQANGAPIVGAMARARQSAYHETGYRGMFGAGMAEGATDDRGEFRFFGLYPGEYYITIFAGSARQSVDAPDAVGMLSSAGGLTRDVNEALLVKAGPGGQTDLGTIVLPSVKSTAPLELPPATVRLRLVSAMENLPGRVSVEMCCSGSGGNEISRKSYPVSRNGIDVPELEAGFYYFYVTWRAGDRTFYGQTSAVVAGTHLERDVLVKPSVRIAGHVSMQEADGSIRPLPRVQVTLRSRENTGATLKATSGKDGAFSVSSAPPWRYSIEVSSLPKDAYLISQQAGGEDISGTNLFAADSDKSVEILAAVSDSAIQGRVWTSRHDPVADAVVALVPDGGRRSNGLLYRKVETSLNGQFTILQVPMGDYHLFAWPELPGGAYRNAEFMSKYDHLGLPVRVEPGGRLTVDVQLLDDPLKR